MSIATATVSIVIPVYNGEKYLRECLQSVLDQTFTDWQCVLIDNGSSDSTPTIMDTFLRRDPRFRLIRNDQVLPALQNHNLAMRSIGPHSTYTQMLHADDRLAAECLEKKVALAQRCPTAAMVGSDVHYAGPYRRGGLPDHRELLPGKEIAARTLLGEMYPFLSPSCLLLRSDVVRAREPFYPENLHGDVQAVYEILQSGDFAFVHEPLVTVGWHADSLTSTLAQPLNRLIAQNFQLFVDYGPRFLSAEQYAVRLQDRLDHYYRFLARALLQRRGATFWNFHRSALEAAGHPLSQRRLLRALARRMATRPLRSLRQVVKLAIRRDAHAETI